MEPSGQVEPSVLSTDSACMSRSKDSDDEKYQAKQKDTSVMVCVLCMCVCVCCACVCVCVREREREREKEREMAKGTQKLDAFHRRQVPRNSFHYVLFKSEPQVAGQLLGAGLFQQLFLQKRAWHRVVRSCAAMTKTTDFLFYFTFSPLTIKLSRHIVKSYRKRPRQHH